MAAIRVKLSTGCALAALLFVPEGFAAVGACSSGSSASPIVIAHRGASGHRPEHTLAAYRYALWQGADFIEADVVATRDGALIARHENLLAEVKLNDDGAPANDDAGRLVVVQATTDVAERAEFAGRLAVKRVDGRPVAGWFSEDFSLAEIRTLRARERMPGLRPYNQLYDDTEVVPTLSEVIALAKAYEGASGRRAGLYIELKHATYFLHDGVHRDGSAIGLDLGALVLAELREADFTDPARVYLSVRMRDAGLSVPLVQLFGDVSNRHYRSAPYDLVYHIRAGGDLHALYGGLADLVPHSADALSYADLATPAALRFMSERYAAAIGPPKQNVLPVHDAAPVDVDGDGRALQRTALDGTVGGIVAPAKAVGLGIHAYTLRLEEPFLVRDGERVLPVAEEARRLLEAGATGIFIDEPAEGCAAVRDYLGSGSKAPGSG
jgi:glycerophosphoryl diester phosphodiesterase